MKIIFKLPQVQNGARYTHTQVIDVNEKVYDYFKRIAVVQFAGDRKNDLIEDGVLTCKFKSVSELSVAIAIIEELKRLAA